jgi:hypothetical protein
MNPVNSMKRITKLRGLYIFSMIFLGLTGFAQMPIFKRYYIADIPGLGWLAQFYVTHYMHYLGAILLLALLAYALVDFVAGNGRQLTLTAAGYVRSSVVAALVLSGVLLVIRNQSGIYMDPRLIIFLDLVHMGLVMGLVIASTYCAVRRRPWVRSRSSDL